MCHSDYKGPMRTGLWWTPPQTWDERYESHLRRVRTLSQTVDQINRALDQTDRLYRSVPSASAKSEYYMKQWDRLVTKLDHTYSLLAEEKREVRLIEEGYHEP